MASGDAVGLTPGAQYEPHQQDCCTMIGDTPGKDALFAAGTWFRGNVAARTLSLMNHTLPEAGTPGVPVETSANVCGAVAIVVSVNGMN
jgi:hypothetical protein